MPYKNLEVSARRLKPHVALGPLWMRTDAAQTVRESDLPPLPKSELVIWLEDDYKELQKVLTAQVSHVEASSHIICCCCLLHQLKRKKSHQQNTCHKQTETLDYISEKVYLQLTVQSD